MVSIYDPKQSEIIILSVALRFSEQNILFKITFNFREFPDFQEGEFGNREFPIPENMSGKFREFPTFREFPIPDVHL